MNQVSGISQHMKRIWYQLSGIKCYASYIRSSHASFDKAATGIVFQSTYFEKVRKQKIAQMLYFIKSIPIFLG